MKLRFTFKDLTIRSLARNICRDCVSKEVTEINLDHFQFVELNIGSSFGIT